MIVDLHEYVVVITGGSRGIGAEIARRCAREGASVIINYKSNDETANELLKEILCYNSNCMAVKADVTKKADVLRLYETVKTRYGHVDVLINNAGICTDNLIQMMTEEQWESVIGTNLTGPFLCSRSFSKMMIHQRYGKIINISSLKGIEGCVGQTNYSASKAGLLGFTKALAKELGKYNIAVNAVCPGFIVTDLNRHNKQKKDIAISRSLLSIDNCMNDVVNFIVFIISDKCKGVSGQIFKMDSRLM